MRRLFLLIVFLSSQSGLSQQLPPQGVVALNQKIVLQKLSTATPPIGLAGHKKAALIVGLSVLGIDCDHYSSVLMSLESVPAGSLHDTALKVNGTSCLTTEGSVRIGMRFIPKEDIRSEYVLQCLVDRQPMLFEWKHNIYVLYGMIYDQQVGGGENYSTYYVVRKFLLIDPRYSNQRRFVSFVPPQDKMNDVSGAAILAVLQ